MKMASKTEADFSSLTSVTEEDGSLSESDTNVTYNSNVSSLKLSTDYNTDDKLSPCLNNISISKTSRRKMKELLNKEQTGDHHHVFVQSSEDEINGLKHCFTRPFDVHYPKRGISKVKHKKRKKPMERNLSSSDKYRVRNDPNFFAVDHPDYNLYTDFSHTNYFPNTAGTGTEFNVEESKEDTENAPDSKRSFLPDMTSSRWYMAKIFDTYWNQYNFVMDWFKEHTAFVHSQSAQLSHSHSIYQYQSESPPQVVKKKSGHKERKRKRARRRRAKAKKKQKANSDTPTKNNVEDVEVEEDDTLEMEITEDMMEFFSQSFKHRLERDKGKENEEKQNQETSRIDIAQAMTGQEGPSESTPRERPGVRRTAEMKLLYGKGAAMIHGMETALQMTFDKCTDRKQPKLWPNMPLKMFF